jgi:hypothetical protein
MSVREPFFFSQDLQQSRKCGCLGTEIFIELKDKNYSKRANAQKGGK